MLFAFLISLGGEEFEVMYLTYLNLYYIDLGFGVNSNLYLLGSRFFDIHAFASLTFRAFFAVGSATMNPKRILSSYR